MKDYKVNVIRWKGKRSFHSLESYYFDDKEEAASFFDSNKYDRFVHFTKFMKKSGVDPKGFAQYLTIIDQYLNDKTPF